MKSLKSFFFVLLVIALLVGAFLLLRPDNPHKDIKVTVFKSEYCGCCENYITGLRGKGFQVEIVNMDNMDSLKEKYSIPESMESCHTAVIGNYFIEGHVPFEAIDKLVEEKPDVKGIALPDMPSGAPGMPGPKKESFEVYAFPRTGEPYVFMTV